MQRISQWYSSFADMTFPTVFIRLHEEEKQLIINNDAPDKVKQQLMARIERVIKALPRPCFAGLDTCSPDDAKDFHKKKSHASAKTVISLLQDSAKVKAALQEGHCESIVLRPYRRMDKTREFRLFVYEKQLSGMSQRHLERQFRRLEGRKDEIWQKGQEFIAQLSPFLEVGNVVIDVYLTSDGQMLIIDFNKWQDSDPLLFRKWDRDWSEPAGLKLMAAPIKMQGDVKVSF